MNNLKEIKGEKRRPVHYVYEVLERLRESIRFGGPESDEDDTVFYRVQ